MASFCVSRLGAPHAGHAALVKAMMAADPGPCLVLVGSSDVVDRADTPLAWEDRQALLRSLLGPHDARLRFAPLPELPTDGWDMQWCAYLLTTAVASLGESPTRYVFGDDYELATFDVLAACAPSLALVRVPRFFGKNARELRTAIAHGDPLLVAKYAAELAVYPPEARQRIARACQSGVDRPARSP